MTTPNRWFPIEPHSKLPLLHWLPRRLGRQLAARLDEPAVALELLSARQFERLFPTVTVRSLNRTRVLGRPMTLVIVYTR